MLKTKWPLIIVCLCFTYLSISAQDARLQKLEQDLLEAESPKYLIWAHIKLAAHLRSRDPSRAFDHAAKATQLSEEHEIPAYRAIARFEKALVFRNSGRHVEALALLDTVLLEQIHLDRKKDIADTYKAIGEISRRENMFEAAEEAYLKSKDLFEEVGDSSDLGYIHRGLGSLERARGNGAKALKHYLQALDLFDSDENRNGVANTHNSIGILYRTLGEPQKAKEHFIENLTIHQEMGQTMGIANAFGNLGSISQGEGDFVDARDYFEQSLDLNRQLGRIRHIAQSTYNLGVLEKDLGNYGKALGHYEESYDLHRKAELNLDPMLMVSLGEVYGLMEQRGNAIKFVEEGISDLEELADIEKKEGVYALAASVFSDLGAFEKAYQAQVSHKIYSDSLLSVSKNDQIVLLETEYAIKEKNAEIAMLETSRRSQRNQLIAGLMAIGLLAGLVFLLLRLNKLKTKANLKLDEQKQSLERKDAQNQMLMKEIHHRVKNNLQVISSLLNLQSRDVEDPALLDAIKEGKNRVKSMALIHENLYQDNHLVNVRSDEYIEKLIGSLVSSYKIDTEKIEVRQSIQSLYLDIEQIVPIGLILNELISNALKHAFRDREVGRIEVDMHKTGEDIYLKVSDDGIGLQSTQDLTRSGSMGMQIIKAFLKKLKATMEVESQDGTAFHIQIPVSSAAA